MPTSSLVLTSRPGEVCVAQAVKYLEPLRLHLNRPEPAIICRTCKYALQPNSVTRHVGKHGIPLWERSALTSLVRALQLPNPQTINTRRNHSPAYPHLAVRCGFAYNRCCYRTTSSDLFSRHIRQEHGGASRKNTTGRLEPLFFQA